MCENILSMACDDAMHMEYYHSIVLFMGSKDGVIKTISTQRTVS
jgi:hypothetical protein